MALTMELEQRVEERTADLRIAHEELNKTNSELLQLTLELEDRVTKRTDELKLVNEALHESEEMYRAVFENTGTAMVLIEENTIITYANAEFEKLSKCSRQEIEGKKSWMDFVVEEDLDQMRAQHLLRRRIRRQL